MRAENSQAQKKICKGGKYQQEYIHPARLVVKVEREGGYIKELPKVVPVYQLVEEDEKDTGVRMTLNFGHTIGHAIENFFNYETYTHGEAVAIGMAHITLRSEALGITTLGTAQALITLIEKYGLPTTPTEYNQQALLESITLDKKNSNNGLHIILLSEMGKALIHRINSNEMHLYL